MNFLNRAIASVIRKPGKTAILLLIIFVLGNIIAGAVSIRQAVENAELTLRTRMSPVTSINFDSEKYSTMYTQNPELELEELSFETVEKIGASTYVKYFDYSAQMMMESSSLKRYVEDMPYYNFIFTGVNNPEIVDMQEGMIRLVSGRVFNDQEIKNLTYVAVVSQEVANANNLAVGSVITFEYSVFRLSGNPTIQKYDFEVIGIFEPVKTMDEELKNGIYTPNRVLNEAMAFYSSEYLKRNPEEAEAYTDPFSFSTLYVLNDPMDLEPFQREVATLLPGYYTVTTASNSFDKLAAPLQSIQEIASLVLCIAVGAAVLAVSLLITLFLRDRRQEIGIYLSLGERKIKVAGQILMEVTVVAVIAITLSLFSGNILSGTVSEKMLVDQIVADQTNEGGYSRSDLAYRYQSATTEDLAASYAVSLNMTTVLLFYAIGFATVCASVLLPIFYITRLNPKKILMGGEL